MVANLMLGLCEGVLWALEDDVRNFSQKEITDEQIWKLFLSRWNQNVPVFKLDRNQINEINFLQKEFNHEILCGTNQQPILEKDILLYAQRDDMEIPLWTTVGCLYWGIHHLMVEYKTKPSKCFSNKHRVHWNELKEWCNATESDSFIDILHKISEGLSQADMCYTQKDNNSELVRLKMTHAITNKHIIVDIIPETGLIITLAKDNEYKNEQTYL